jgi:hypothetical protein
MEVCDEKSRRDIVRHFASLTPNKILKGSYPSMAVLRKQHESEKIENVLGVLIQDASRAFGNAWSDDQCVELSTEILSMYYYLSLEDCYLVLQRVKRSKVYGLFCMNTILQAFNDYDQERYTKADDLAYSKHLSQKTEELVLPKEGLSDEGKKVLDKLTEKLKASKVNKLTKVYKNTSIYKRDK